METCKNNGFASPNLTQSASGLKTQNFLAIQEAEINKEDRSSKPAVCAVSSGDPISKNPLQK
jgi:hypothetical protein